jgi:hypothetical protein
VEGNDPQAFVGVCGIRRMRERRVEKKGDDQMARKELKSIFVCKKEDHSHNLLHKTQGPC